MPASYDNYLKSQKSLSFEEANALHEMIISEIWGDEKAGALYDELIERAADYVPVRARWTVRDAAWRLWADDGRTELHDQLIEGFDQLAEHLRSTGKTADWREILGYESDDRYNRKRLGDMGCYLVCIHSLSGR